MLLVTSVTYLQLIAILSTVIDAVSPVGNPQWLPGTNTPLTSRTGHDVIIKWIHQHLPDDDSITISKNNVAIASYVMDNLVMLIDDKRYHLQKTEHKTIQEIILTISNVTLEDSGIYRCYLDLLKKYRDIQLAVTDFRWLKTRNPVKSTLRQDVKLVWEYQNSRPLHKIDIIRFDNNTNQVENIGEWTVVNGFVVDPFLSTEVELILRGERITLKLSEPIYKDFDKIYRCQVYYGESFSEVSEIQLIAERPALTFAYHIIKDELHLVWNYRYRYPVVAVILVQKGSNLTELGFWYQGKFEIEKHYMGRLMFKKTRAEIDGFIEENITLTILNVTHDDLKFSYRCEIIPGDGQKITLDKVPTVNWNITITEQPSSVQKITKGDMINLTVTASSDLSLQYQWYFNNQAYDLIPPFALHDTTVNQTYIDTRVLSGEDYRKVDGIYTLNVSNIFQTVQVTTEIVLVEADPVTSFFMAVKIAAITTAVIALVIILITIFICWCTRRRYCNNKPQYDARYSKECVDNAKKNDLRKFEVNVLGQGTCALGDTAVHVSDKGDEGNQVEALITNLPSIQTLTDNMKQQSLLDFGLLTSTPK
ncbi:uncharacterized protein LOC126832555 [Patella vulgata]|uniref:uncharacterized protein LOC126832555 n=1 Tax=Patella vulgata TaxID=6465 RepID=UPI00217F35F5|nr:uncharacterized protein LOC126832555 [Patella vulgata]